MSPVRVGRKIHDWIKIWWKTTNDCSSSVSRERRSRQVALKSSTQVRILPSGKDSEVWSFLVWWFLVLKCRPLSWKHLLISQITMLKIPFVRKFPGFEPVMASWEAQTLPLCCTPPAGPGVDKNIFSQMYHFINTRFLGNWFGAWITGKHEHLTHPVFSSSCFNPPPPLLHVCCRKERKEVRYDGRNRHMTWFKMVSWLGVSLKEYSASIQIFIEWHQPFLGWCLWDPLAVASQLLWLWTKACPGPVCPS